MLRVSSRHRCSAPVTYGLTELPVDTRRVHSASFIGLSVSIRHNQAMLVREQLVSRATGCTVVLSQKSSLLGPGAGCSHNLVDLCGQRNCVLSTNLLLLTRYAGAILVSVRELRTDLSIATFWMVTGLTIRE